MYVVSSIKEYTLQCISDYAMKIFDFDIQSKYLTMLYCEIIDINLRIKYIQY